MFVFCFKIMSHYFLLTLGKSMNNFCPTRSFFLFGTERQQRILTYSVKADSHLPQWSAFSAVDCVNTEIENFLSLCRNANVHCGTRTSVNEP